MATNSLRVRVSYVCDPSKHARINTSYHLKGLSRVAPKTHGLKSFGLAVGDQCSRDIYGSF